MTPHHHLDPSSIIAYAAGAAAPEFAAVVATHLVACPACRRRVASAERVGGLLLEQQQPPREPDQRRAQLREAMLECLAEPATATETGAAPVASDCEPVRTVDLDRLPLPLQPYFGKTYSGLKWRWVAPGIHNIHAAGTDQLLLLKVAPGRSLPRHRHDGNELTHVLRGAYYDEIGHFAKGDVADLDGDVEHRPVTAPGVDCICVCALDAPLQFTSRLIRALQPIFRF